MTVPIIVLLRAILTDLSDRWQTCTGGAEEKTRYSALFHPNKLKGV
jgi:hypothetical protein